MALDETSKVISLSCKAFDVSFNIKSTICNNCSFVNESKLIISSTLFKNSGLKYSFNLSISLSLLTVSFPKPIELLLINNNSIGFGNETVNKDKLIDRLKEYFRPEFLNRVDEIISFDSLTKEQLLQIVDLMLKDTSKALQDKDITLEVSSKAKNYLLEKGTDIKFGARPLRRAIQRYIEDELSEMILRGQLIDGQKVVVDFEKDKLKFKIED